jgi:hypothetical protein
MPFVDDLSARLDPLLGASKGHAFSKWKFTELLIGTAWDDEILEALIRHRIGLLLLSPTFLMRSYIVREELPRLLAAGQIALPVLLKPIDMRRMELRGLDALQIFAMRVRGERRAYSRLRAEQRDDFAFALYQAIEARLERDL